MPTLVSMTLLLLVATHAQRVISGLRIIEYWGERQIPQNDLKHCSVIVDEDNLNCVTRSLSKCKIYGKVSCTTPLATGNLQFEFEKSLTKHRSQ